TNFLDNISNMSTIAFDKTGTITSGNFSVTDIDIKNQYYTRDEVLKLCYFGEKNSSHPIAKAIVNFATPHIAEYNDDPVQPENYHEQAGTGVSYVLDGELIMVGKSKTASDNAKTSVSLFVNEEEIAVVYLADTIKENTESAIAYLKSKGIKTEMLTGDNDAVAKGVASEIGIESYRASMLPEDKFTEIENIISQKQKKTDTVVFVGDGINDAPVLGRADIGIAMGLSGSAATVDTADVVLMNDDLSQLVTLHKLSKRTRRIVSENIIATLVIKLTFVILGLCSVTGLAWAVFADVGLTCCTVFNSLRALKYNPKK
ncbi:MAG: HAD-IC family P-type ATPase, partial [Clostridia bacterium]|nr:HAD-IC family P-type ATPase [Clostridia bacterium]